MTGDGADSQLSPAPVDPWPTLRPEYRLAFVTRSGWIERTGVLTEEEAQAIAGGFKVARWRLERRMVTEWVADGPNMETRVVVEQVDAIPELDPGATDDSEG